MIDQRDLIKLEEQVWDALVSGDQKVDSLLLADDFLGIYGTGIEGKEDHMGQLAGGPTIRQYALSKFTFKVLGPDTALLSYRADYSRQIHQPGTEMEAMYVSSIWQRREETWLNIFSQDTALTE